MRPDPQIFTFVIAWTIGTLGLALIATLYYGSMQLTTDSSLLLFCFGIILIYQHFSLEVPKSKEKFLKIFGDLLLTSLVEVTTRKLRLSL